MYVAWPVRSTAEKVTGPAIPSDRRTIGGLRGVPTVPGRNVFPTPLTGLKSTAGGAAAMLKVTVAVAVVEPLVAVMVTCADDTAEGVPEITPLVESILKPAGKVP